MGAQMNSGRRMGAKGSTRGGYRPMSEINVTPFVDVMLVLLIVFMVTAPLLSVGVPVDLPESSAPALADPVEPVVISVDKEGKVYISETEIDINQLADKLFAILGEKRDTRIYIRGDKAINYGSVMTVMGVITSAGFTKVALVASEPK